MPLQLKDTFKQQSDNTLFNDTTSEAEDYKKFGASMLTSYVMDHDMNVQIFLGYLQPVHLGDHSHLILGLDHHHLLLRLP